MVWIVSTVVVVLVLVLALIWWRRMRATGALVSVVVLRSRPIEFTEADVRGAFRRVFGEEPTVMPIQPDENCKVLMLVPGKDSRAVPLAVLCATRPYTEPGEAERVAQNAEHPEVRRALLEHTSWVSVDAAGLPPTIDDAQQRMVHTLLARFATEFIDEHSLLLYQPRTQRVALPTPENIDLLRQHRDDEVFADGDVNQPMVNVKPDDAQIQRAMDEAQRRVDECLEAFRARGEQAEVMLKLRFDLRTPGGASAEYIWSRLVRVSGRQVTCEILNNPIDASVPKKGEQITVGADRVVDWMYIDEKGEAQGAIVERLLKSRRG
jgi:uncharacterized protein YegJ (DUF2314 family)